MREILFRGKRADNGEWIYGDLLHNICTTKIREKDTDIERIAKSYSVIPDTVGQNTGLKDKNGKKIFENDVLKIFAYGKEYVGAVTFTNGNFCVMCGEKVSPFLDDVLIKRYHEHIGNKWEVEG